MHVLNYVWVSVGRYIDNDWSWGPVVKATEGVTNHEEIDDKSVGIIQSSKKDFIFNTPDYAIGDGTVIPSLKDLIKIVYRGTEEPTEDDYLENPEIYETVAVHGTQQQRFFAIEPWYSYTSSTKLRMRVHTIQVAFSPSLDSSGSL